MSLDFEITNNEIFIIGVNDLDKDDKVPAINIPNGKYIFKNLNDSDYIWFKENENFLNFKEEYTILNISLRRFGYCDNKIKDSDISELLNVLEIKKQKNTQLPYSTIFYVTKKINLNDISRLIFKNKSILKKTKKVIFTVYLDDNFIGYVVITSKIHNIYYDEEPGIYISLKNVYTDKKIEATGFGNISPDKKIIIGDKKNENIKIFSSSNINNIWFVKKHEIIKNNFITYNDDNQMIETDVLDKYHISNNKYLFDYGKKDLEAFVKYKKFITVKDFHFRKDINDLKILDKKYKYKNKTLDIAYITNTLINDKMNLNVSSVHTGYSSSCSLSKEENLYDIYNSYSCQYVFSTAYFYFIKPIENKIDIILENEISKYIKNGKNLIYIDAMLNLKKNDNIKPIIDKYNNFIEKYKNLNYQLIYYNEKNNELVFILSNYENVMVEELDVEEQKILNYGNVLKIVEYKNIKT